MCGFLLFVQEISIFVNLEGEALHIVIQPVIFQATVCLCITDIYFSTVLRMDYYFTFCLNSSIWSKWILGDLNVLSQFCVNEMQKLIFSYYTNVLFNLIFFGMVKKIVT